MPTNSLIYHPTVTHYLKFVATTVGRDKLLRTLQYFSRFYAWYLYRTNALPSTISPYTTIKTKFGETRKFLRIGKFVEHFKAAAVAADSKGLDGVVKYCAVGRQLGYAGYLSLDAVTVLGVLGLKNFTKEGKERVQREAYRFWMFGLLFSTMSSVYSLYNLRLQQQRIDKKEGEGVVAAKRIEKERAAINLQLISDLCDLTVPTSAIGITNFDDGFVGLAGTVSSLIGVYSQWKKTA